MVTHSLNLIEPVVSHTQELIRLRQILSKEGSVNVDQY